MNGAEHYREADRLVNADPPFDPRNPDSYMQLRVENLLAAQAHATLALAAAQALSAITGSSAPLGHPVHQLADDDETIDALNAWHEATRVVRKREDNLGPVRCADTNIHPGYGTLVCSLNPGHYGDHIDGRYYDQSADDGYVRWGQS